ncbi:MAG: bacteriohemerythrin [Pseudomonadota bacterium]
MPIIEWTDSLSVGVKDLDEQHQKWFAIYNKAHDQMMSGSIEALNLLGPETLKEMIAYTNFHFASEEQFMEKMKYPGLEDHKALHKNFIRRLDQVALEIHRGEFILNSEVIKLIQNWLINHIMVEDMKINVFAGK